MTTGIVSALLAVAVLCAIAWVMVCSRIAHRELTHSAEVGDGAACITVARIDHELMAQDLALAVRQRAELIDAIEQHMQWLIEHSAQHSAAERFAERASSLRQIFILRQHLKTAGCRDK